jgi:anti-sigma B factor antagonist
MRALRLRQEPTGTAVPRVPRTDEPAQRHGSVLSVNCEEREGLIVLRLAGNLDIYTVPVFQERVRRYDPAEVQMVIDLAGVELLDSTGLGALVSLRNRARREGGRLGLVCPDHRLMRLFWFTGLRPAFAFGDDLATVRSALAEGAGLRIEPGRGRAR